MEAKHRVGKLCVDLLTELRPSKDGNEENLHTAKGGRGLADD